MKIYYIIFVCLVALIRFPSQGKGWHGIVPLRTTRLEVEKLLGPSVEEGYAVTYDLGDKAVSIEYSSAPCKKGKGGGEIIPPDTVIRIRVATVVKPILSDLNINKRKYRVVEDRELPGVSYYINEEKGLTYQVEDGLVTFTEYGVSAKDKPLQCDDPH